MLPTISIVTPSYNQDAFLEDTLRSVLGQGSDLHEYVIMDGGSTDRSIEIIERYAHRLSWWQSRADGGQSAAIDDGFRRCSGEVVGWVNSDDLLLPGTLAAVRRMFAENPSLQVVSGWVVLIDERSRVIKIRRPPVQTLRAARWGLMHVAQQACFFRRELYHRVGGLDRGLDCVMDTELWVRMLLETLRFGHLPKILAAFRIHPASKGQSWLQKYSEEEELLRKRYPSMMGARRLRHGIAKAVYRAGEIVTLRYPKDAIATRVLAGRPVEELPVALRAP